VNEELALRAYEVPHSLGCPGWTIALFLGESRSMTSHSTLVRSLSVAAVAALALAGVSACSSSSTSPSSSPTVSSPSASPTTATATATVTPKPTTASPTSTVRPPVAPIIIVKGGNKTVQVGDTLDITTELVTKVSTSNPAVLKVSQPSKPGANPQMNGGAEAIAVGTAVLNVYGTLMGGAPNALLYTVKVTVK